MHRVRFLLNGEEILLLVTAINLGVPFYFEIVRNFTTTQGYLAKEISKYQFIITAAATGLLVTGLLLSQVLVNEFQGP